MNLCFLRKLSTVSAICVVSLLVSAASFADEVEVAEEAVTADEVEVTEEVSLEDEGDGPTGEALAVEESDAADGDADAQEVEVAEEASEALVEEPAEEVVTVEQELVPDEAVTPEVVEEVALDDEVDALVEEEAEETVAKPWRVSTTLRSVIGQGTFVKPTNDTQWAGHVDDGGNAYNRVSLVGSIAPSYKLGDFTLGMGMTWVQWLTPGGGMNAPYELRFQDISLSASWVGYTIEAIGVHLAPGASVSLPTSELSRTQTLYFDTSLSLGVSRTFFERLSLSYSLSGSKYFHEYKSPVISVEKVGVDNVIYRTGGAEDVAPGRVAIGGYNSEYMLGNAFGLSYTIWSTLSASASYGIYSYWSYHFDNDDEYTSEHARTGRGLAQITSSSIGLNYGINRFVSVRGSLNTQQPPKTADNQSFRFPFWNFNGAANNYSSVQFSVTGTY